MSFSIKAQRDAKSQGGSSAGTTCVQIFHPSVQNLSKANKLSTISSGVNINFTQGVEYVDKLKHCVDNPSLIC
ncbi:hypothetical protein YDYSY3_54810 [Paenibacillus chitinolyticus]|nr:hypothetical protein YDYSY3_54810 [Paenibacillus chitinolyticus]